MSNVSHVVAIFICLDRGARMQVVSSVRAFAGVGLEGDRYASGRGAWSKVRETIRHVSLIEREAIDQANQSAAVPFLMFDTRRNLVTEGVDLNSLVGKTFEVGAVQMRGVELCSPCGRPSTISGKKGFAAAFEGRGGLRAEILNDGMICPGDAISIS